MAYSRLDLDIRIQFYQKRAGDGIYHNPHDVDEELTDMLNKCNLSKEEKIEYEDEIHYTGMLFWDM
jgi:hypothetical protein